MHRAEAQPDIDDEGKPTGTLRVLYECVQCDGYRVKYEQEPDE